MHIVVILKYICEFIDNPLLKRPQFALPEHKLNLVSCILQKAHVEVAFKVGRR